eukprot:gene9675-8500_t
MVSFEAMETVSEYVLIQDLAGYLHSGPRWALAHTVSFEPGETVSEYRLSGDWDTWALGLSSVAIEKTWISETKYSFGNSASMAQQFAKSMKLGIVKLPVSSTAEMKTSFLINFPDGSEDKVVGTLLVYDEPVTLKYNGKMTISFASGYVFETPFPAEMTAADGRYAILRTTSDLYGSDSRRLLAAKNSSSADPTFGDDHEFFEAEYLQALPMEDPVKHRTIALYKVTKHDKSWAAVAEAFRCPRKVIKGIEP